MGKLHSKSKVVFLVIMQCNGSSISWDHLHQLYERNRLEAGLSLIPKLKYEHIHLTTFSKMRLLRFGILLLIELFAAL